MGPALSSFPHPTLEDTVSEGTNAQEIAVAFSLYVKYFRLIFIEGNPPRRL